MHKERLGPDLSPLWLALLIVVFLTFAIVYATLVPPFEGPDSGAHFGYIAYLREHQRLPLLDADTAQRSHELVQQPPLYYSLVAALTPAHEIEPASHLHVTNPYYDMGMSKRATIALPENPPATSALWIARLLAMAGGLLTMAGTWLLVRELLPGSPTSALAAAAVVGLNPQFLFASGAITNDTWCAAGAVFAVWWAVYCVRRDVRQPLSWLLLGALVGLASLVKYSDLVVVVPLAVVVLPHLWKARRQRGLLMGLCALAGALGVGGFWYIRNLVLYGEVVPLASMMAALPALSRDEALSIIEIWQRLPLVLKSYWGLYGYGVPAQPWFHQLMIGLMAAAFLGLLVFLFSWRSHHESGQTRAVLLALLWLGGTLASFLQWMRLVSFTEQGRLLFAAAPAVALLLVIGWQNWLPRAFQPWLHRLLPLVLAALAVTQIPILREAYRIPAPVTGPVSPDRPLNVQFEAGMDLLGIDLPRGAALNQGEGLPLTLYFRARREITDFYTLFIHLADDENNLLWQYDGVPDIGRHPTRQWLPGQVFADSYFIYLEDIPADKLVTLSVGFYDYDEPARRQRLVNSSKEADRVILARVRLNDGSAPAKPLVRNPLAEWSNGIELGAADVDIDGAGAPRKVHLRWQARTPIQSDYTVSVQLLDDHARVLAQVDRQPVSGAYPTSTWQAGDVIEDVYTLTPAAGRWQRLVVLLYDQTGKRLPLDVQFSSPANVFVLARRGEAESRPQAARSVSVPGPQ